MEDNDLVKLLRESIIKQGIINIRIRRKQDQSSKAGPLLITLIFKSSLHPKGWKGFSLDLAGLILLLGAITLVGNGPQPDGEQKLTGS